MRAQLKRFDSLLQHTTHRLCLIAGWGMVSLSVVVTLNVLFRKLFNFSLQGVDEYGGYCLAIVASIGFSQAAFERAHIRIDVLTQLLPGRLRAVFDVVALVALNIFAWTLAIKAYGVFADSLRMGALATSVLRTPLSVPQGIWVGALAWFCLTVSVQLLRAVLALLQGDWRAVSREFGMPDLKEEVQHEVEQARHRLAEEDLLTQEKPSC